MNARIFHNGQVLTARGFERDACAVVEDGHIVALLHGEPPSGGERIDLQGGWLVPGFIDVQVNGGGGALLNDAPAVQTVRTIAASHRRFGTVGRGVGLGMLARAFSVSAIFCHAPAAMSAA